MNMPLDSFLVTLWCMAVIAILLCGMAVFYLHTEHRVPWQFQIPLYFLILMGLWILWATPLPFN